MRTNVVLLPSVKSTPDVDSKRDDHIYDTLPESSGKDEEKKFLKA